MKHNFVSDLFFTLGAIGRIAVTIAAKATGLLGVGFVWVLFCCIIGFFLPMGGTICFVVLKLTHLLRLGWIWILAPLVLDGFCIPSLLNIYTGKN